MELSNKYKYFDGMTWPLPDSQREESDRLQWILRYGTAESIVEKRMEIASIINAYDALFHKAQKQRNYIVEKIKN